ncbi:MAG: T9SS C-terminal target domain-containing protein, partial [Bacteroidetes bacterium]
INFQPAGSPGGENYGWRCYEGSLEYNTEDCRDRGEYTFPVHEYAHDPGGHCSVTGGFVYRGMDYPVLRGHYFFADHCSGALWSLRDTAGEWVAGDHGKYTGNGFSTFGEDSRGELYVAGLESGILFRVASSGGTSSEGTLPAPGSRVWPNPAGERLRVEPGMQGKGGVRATLFDLEGKKVFGSGPYNGSFSLDLGGLPAGVYILSLQAGTERETHRITKE